MRNLFAIFTLVFLFFSSNLSAATEWKKPIFGFAASKVRVLQTSYYDGNGKKSHIYALHFKIKEGWKLYGEGSEGVGISPVLTFIDSSNVKKYVFFWPKAKHMEQKIGDQLYRYDAYEDEVVIPFEVYGDIKDGSVISFDLLYGVCSSVCIPVSNRFDVQVNKVVNEESFALIKSYLTEFDIYLSKDGKSTQNVDISKENNMPMITLLYALLAAFLGGLILNIMPCVLPVLSIKLIAILQNNSQNLTAIRVSFLATVAGILFSFLVLSALVSGISYSGDVFNWGLQFQNPFFLTFLIGVFVIFIANILGYFSINGSGFLSNYLNKKIDNSFVRRKIIVANFLSGILAVLLATPCSAPFLGAAITFSVMQSTFFIFMIFIAMGVGFAFPYLLLIAFPHLIRFLPKSGPWTKVAKNILASFVLLTAVWLCYVLYKNSGLSIALTVLTLCVVLLFSFKIKYKLFRTLVVLTLLLSIFSAPNVSNNGINYKEDKVVASHDMLWRSFERIEIDRYVSQGKVVVIDVTADWCLTCKFNKYKVLSDKDVVEFLKSEDVIAMRADITKPNKIVMDFINGYGRYAIPFNMVFGPNAKDGILMSELLDKEDLINAMKKAAK